MRRSKKDEAESRAALDACLAYLQSYAHSRETWKFSKPRQNYILKNVYGALLEITAATPAAADTDTDAEPRDGPAAGESRQAETDLMCYLQGLQGAARERCLGDAKRKVQRYARQQKASAAAKDNGDSTAQTKEASNAEKTNGDDEEQMQEEGKEEDDTEEEEDHEPVTLEQSQRAQTVLDRLQQDGETAAAATKEASEGESSSESSDED